MPYHDALLFALEFEVDVARAARRGTLCWSALADAFGALVQTRDHNAAQIAAPLPIDALTEALLRLPAGLAHAKGLWAVPHLGTAGLAATPEQGLWPSARLVDGNLVIACGTGLGALNGLVAALCSVAWAAAVWRSRTAQSTPHRAAAKSASSDAANDRDHSTHSALCAGVTRAAWQAADAACGGQLETLLNREIWPDLRIHAHVYPSDADAAAQRQAQAILAVLAELGLIGRPMHLWVGPSGVTDTCSPYARDLGPGIVTWAKANLLKTQANAACGLYASMAAFLRCDAALIAEQHMAEQSVGIWRHEGPVLSWDLIDVGRLDVAACDPDIAACVATAAQMPYGQAPIIVRLNPDPTYLTAPVAGRLVAALAQTLRSATVMTSGLAPSAYDTNSNGHGDDNGKTSLACPQVLLPWHNGAPCPIASPGTSGAAAVIDAAHCRMTAVRVFVDVPILGASCPTVLTQALCAQGFGTTFGQMPLALALARSLAQRPSALPPVGVHWYVSQSPCRSADTDAGLAKAQLRVLFGSDEQAPAAAPDPSTSAPNASARTPPKSRGVRLRV